MRDMFSFLVEFGGLVLDGFWVRGLGLGLGMQ